jgi:hypothetical protein
VLLAAVTAAVKVVTPTIAPTVVPRALEHQNTAIAAAAMARAKNLRGAVDSLLARWEAKKSFAISSHPALFRSSCICPMKVGSVDARQT